MKRITLKAIFMALFFTVTVSFSQTSSNIQTLFGQELTDANIKSLEESDVIRCGSVEYEKYLQSLHPERATKDEFESWLAPKVQEIQAQRSNGASIMITLPVVYHIITNGTGSENLSAATIQAQNDQLNLDFGNSSGSPYSVAADTEVEFCLATENESGSTLFEPGINRVTDFGDGPFSRPDFENNIKPQTQWDPTRYFNVWVGDLGGSLLGYAQFPSNSGLQGLNTNGGDANTDGVVVLYSSVGSVANPSSGGPYNLGRTLTHEVGHWLGLRHIWGDSSACTNDDFCADTPNATNSNSGCPTVDSCPSDGLGADMVENYMDYSNDACLNTFTADQKTRIQAVLANSPRRMELATSTVCEPAVVYDYDGAIEIENLNIEECGTTFAPTVVITNNGNFNLNSAVISYQIDSDTAFTESWTGFLFSNQSETVTLPTLNISAGSHTFTVELTSPSGNTDQNTVDNTAMSSEFSVFFDTTTVNLSLLTDDYGSETYWEFKDANDAILYSGSGYTDNITVNESFDVTAGGCYSFTIYDTEGDGICCGYGIGNYTLTDSNSNVIAAGGEFETQETVSITANSTLGTGNYLSESEITLFPNPTTDVLNIKLRDSNSLPDTYTIYNMLGQVVLQQSIAELNDLTVNTSSLSKGMYFIKIATDNASMSLPFVKK
ncbi:MAG: M43 family zinc metalloprotease [Flavobacteriaceae bacterium]|nr:M43 family zinc metalloprotease [Flavobacteriaceae bacterium]